MLPNVTGHGGVNLFAFDHGNDFPLDIATTTRDGACSGLSLHWIKKHKLGQLATFRATILAPSSIRGVENFQSTIGNYATAAVTRALTEAGLSRGISKDITTGLTANRVAQALMLTQGYELLSFVSNGEQHTIAGARTGDTVDFFDANYGCAQFISRDDFKAWFIADYWNVADGPGNPGPCTRFMSASFF
jgi:hypothetical protein